ncbi:MAG: acyl--CoA ligase [Candidatus Obscuribacterales bacterium]|nr:acyl--CoA ligase [Candidatus Obscuribacterales bacterium]
MKSGVKETEVNSLLSHDDVIRRLFAPASNLPEPRSAQAIIVTASTNERSVTHSQIENLIAHAVEQLMECGVKAGDKVAFYSKNSPEFTSTILACWAMNAMVVLIDYRMELTDVLAMCKKLDIKLVVTLKTMYRDFASTSKLFCEEQLSVLDVSQFIDFKNEDSQSRQLDIQAIDVDRPAFAILTSGTTGTPKTSVHTLRSLVRNIIDLAEAADLQAGMTAVTPLPISHVFGLIVFLVTQTVGLKTVLTPLEPVRFVKTIGQYKPELIAALPQFYGALMSAPDGFIDLSKARLLLCGGSALTISLADKFEQKFGKRLNNGYGSTECKLVAFNKNGPALSVGKPVDGIKIDIVNEQEEVQPEGKNGEIRITGSMLMSGYLDNEKESKKVLRNGHYYTEDIGRLEDGYLFVVGRKNEIILVSGVIVQVGEVEEALRNCPAVKDVAVTSVPNKRLGEIVKASIVLVDDEIADQLKSSDQNERREAQQELQRQFKAFCQEHLSRYKRPMQWEFLGPHDNLPKTLAGKTDKKAMKGS